MKKLLTALDLTAAPGAKFHCDKFASKIEGMRKSRALQTALRTLEIAGLVRFTGTPCIWERC